MFDRFTDHAKKIMSQTRKASLRLNHDYIDAPHMLLGLLETEGCMAMKACEQLRIDTAALHQKLEQKLKPGRTTVKADALPFTPRAKRVLEAAMHAAADLGHNHVGSEHLLLGLVQNEEGPAGQMLREAGATLEATRTALASSASSSQPAAKARRLLLISNSTMHGRGYLEHCAHEIRDFLGERKRVLFVPYALANHDEYAARAALAFAEMGHDIVPAHKQPDPAVTAASVEAVFVGGGNTFRLLTALYRTRLLRAIADRVAAGMPYVGSSAGTVVATPSLSTTNDMPIVMPPSFAALGLVPFQVNAHYLDPDPGSKHMGETREERIRQFHEENEPPVLGLREGSMLRVEGERMELRGTTNARLFRRGQQPEEYQPPCDLSFLLARPRGR